jgi:hypothetical protein
MLLIQQVGKLSPSTLRLKAAVLLFGSFAAADTEDMCVGYKLPKAYGGNVDWTLPYGQAYRESDGHLFRAGATWDTSIGAYSTSYSTAFYIEWDSDYEIVDVWYATETATDYIYTFDNIDCDDSSDMLVMGG